METLQTALELVCFLVLPSITLALIISRKP
jgi:hypothetical protein